MKILQLAHGKVIPKYSSAYALRCHSYLAQFNDRVLYSISGLVYRDKKEDYARQYRSIITFAYSVIKKHRSLEYLISRGKFLRKRYISDVKEVIKESDIIVFEGPWQYYLFRDSIGDKRVVYDAHNVESKLRKGNIWEDYTFLLEKDLATISDLIITMTHVDAKLFSSLYGIQEEKILCIPEGFKIQSNTWAGIDSKNIVFIGSAYFPNIEAVNLISKIAHDLPQFKFRIIGSVCSAVRRRTLPHNVELLGLLTESQKDEVLNTSFLALNPVLTGSGMNFKMNDYINHGIPILTTEIGARGFDSDLASQFILTGPEELIEKIKWVDKEREMLINRSKFFLEYVQKECSKPYDFIIREAFYNLVDS